VPAARQEKAYEKHAWTLLFALGVVGLLLALIDIFSSTPDGDYLVMFRNFSGTTWEKLLAADPGVANFIRFILRGLGLALAGSNLFLMAVALKSFRRGEKWAWYVSLYLPVSFGIVTALDFKAGGIGWPVLLVFLIISLLGLVLPYRKFFPKEQAVAFMTESSRLPATDFT